MAAPRSFNEEEVARIVKRTKSIMERDDSDRRNKLPGLVMIAIRECFPHRVPANAPAYVLKEFSYTRETRRGDKPRQLPKPKFDEPKPKPEAVETVREVVRPLSDFPTAELAEELFRKVAAAAAEAASNLESVHDRLVVLERSVSHLIRVQPNARHSEQPRAPKVVVLGLKGDQANSLQKLIGNLCDIENYETKRWKSLGTKPQAELYVASRWVDHSSYELMPGVKFIDGTVFDIARWIRSQLRDVGYSA